ncbi:MAG: cell division protein SepF [Thermoplasmata archaeon]|nr:cell division protein SepF [Thermoplasmata archaeon]MCI4361575.1 cell division protein SepF [Thermoplasmata archaeon]
MMKKSGLLRRHHGNDTLEEGTFLDLGTMGFEEDAGGPGTKGTIRLAEILRFDDLHNISKLAYQGDIVMIDYTSIANDASAVRRMSVDLKNVAKDVNGDVAGIAKNLLALTPAGIRIDRQKIRPSF